MWFGLETMVSANPPIEALIEALLFVADGPVSIAELSHALEREVDEVQQALAQLGQQCDARGTRVLCSHGRFQLVTAPEAGPAIQRLLGQDGSDRLSPAALETLAIIAYNQPVTRAQVETIRGVNSDSVIRTLVGKGLVASAGRLEQVGRPELLSTTGEFLQYFGLSSLHSLPALPDAQDAPDPSEALGVA
jgi:segregation and condensation protein B